MKLLVALSTLLAVILAEDVKVVPAPLPYYAGFPYAGYGYAGLPSATPHFTYQHLASSARAQVLHEESDQLRDQTGEEPGDRFVKKDTKFHQVEGAAPLSAPPENEPRKRPPS